MDTTDKNKRETDFQNKLNKHRQVTLGELRTLIEQDGEIYFNLTPLDKNNSAARILGYGVPITIAMIETLCKEDGWDMGSDKEITVTTNPKSTNLATADELSIQDYVDMFHYHLGRYLRPGRKASDRENIATLIGRFFADHMSEKKIEKLKVKKSDLKPVESYLDHLANCEVLFLATLIATNKRNREWRPPKENPLKKRPDVYDLREMDKESYDFRKIVVPPSVLSTAFAVLFHDVSLVGKYSPAEVGVSCFSEEYSEELIGHGGKSFKMLDKYFTDMYVVRNLMRDHQSTTLNTGKDFSVLTEIARIVDLYDEYAASKPLMYGISQLMDPKRFKFEVVKDFFSIFEPFSNKDIFPLFSGINEQFIEIGKAEVINASKQYSPMIKIGSVLDKRLEVMVGAKILLDASEENKFYI